MDPYGGRCQATTQVEVTLRGGSHVPEGSTHQEPPSPKKSREGNWLVTDSRSVLPEAGHQAGRVDTCSAAVARLVACAHWLPGGAVGELRALTAEALGSLEPYSPLQVYRSWTEHATLSWWPHINEGGPQYWTELDEAMPAGSPCTWKPRCSSLRASASSSTNTGSGRKATQCSGPH